MSERNSARLFDNDSDKEEQGAYQSDKKTKFQNFETKFREKQKACCFFCCGTKRRVFWCCALLQFIVCVIFIAIIIAVTHKPRPPMAEVIDLIKTSDGMLTEHYFLMNVQVNVSITNPNLFPILITSVLGGVYYQGKNGIYSLIHSDQRYNLNVPLQTVSYQTFDMKLEYSDETITQEIYGRCSKNYYIPLSYNGSVTAEVFSLPQFVIVVGKSANISCHVG